MSKRNDALSGEALARFTRRFALQIRVAGRVSRKRKNLLDRLLTDGSGPLFDRERQEEFGPALDTILDRLEPR